MKKASDSNIETHDIALIKLKARDRTTLETMAKRYGANHLIDFLEGIIMKEQGPNIVARFYDDPPENWRAAKSRSNGRWHDGR